MRPTDNDFQAALSRRDSIVLVKGARQMGKTSLLARGLQQARQAGAKVVLTDFQKLNATHLASVESFFLTLGDFLADQLDLGVLPEAVWDPRRGPNTNFERYLRREVLGKLSGHSIWALMRWIAFSPVISAEKFSASSIPGTTSARWIRMARGRASLWASLTLPKRICSSPT